MTKRFLLTGLLILAAAFHGDAADIEGKLATAGGSWPAPFGCFGFLANELLTPQYVWIAVVVVVLVVGAILGAYKLREAVLRDLLKALRAEGNAVAPAMRMEQPMTVQFVEQFVKVDAFRAELEHVDHRLGGIERIVQDVLTNPKGYLHESAHETRDSLNAILLEAKAREDRLMDKIEEAGNKTSEKVAAVHQRIDQLASLQGTLSGLVQGLTSATKEATRAANAAAIAAAEAKSSKGGRNS